MNMNSNNPVILSEATRNATNNPVILSEASRHARGVVEGPRRSSHRLHGSQLSTTDAPPTSRLNFAVKLLPLLLFLLSSTNVASAHVGNKDVFQTINAGPYKLYVTIRPPNVIPGIAIVEVRTDSAVTGIRIAPLPLIGEASKHSPTPDDLKPEPGLPGSFSGSIWLMAPGSWQVHFDVDGAQGHATAGVPVPAVALSMLKMQRPLGMLLAFLGLVLVVGMAGIVSAAVREASVAPGAQPTPARKRRALAAGTITLALLLIACVLGNKWWNVEAADYADSIYRPLKLMPTLTGDTLGLVLGSGAADADTVHGHGPSDLVLDHNHLMHLYAIRSPQMDAVFHLHPAMTGDWHFTDALPPMPPGEYKLFADIVHRNGFPETLTATIMVPADLPATPLAPEDARATPAPLSAGMLGATFKLPDGDTMVWDKPAEIASGTGYTFHFTLLGPDGKPATDVVPYLGMAGHAAFVKSDFSTFAHTHPDGSAAMPAVMLANSNDPDAMDARTDMNSAVNTKPMPGMTASDTTHLAPSVDFPYGFPSAGRYRIFIQMRHGTGSNATVETGVFDADVK